MELLWGIAAQTALVLYEGSLYILLGFFVAGLLHEFLPGGVIARHLGADRPRSVVLAALIGAPIPLCSCGVLPAIAALRRKGASRSALLSFAISTPETGVDSIALTYGLLGPVMALVRPLAAVASAIAAGLLWLVVGRDEAQPSPRHDAAAHPDGDACHVHAEPELLETSPGGRWPERLRRALGYGFGGLLDEIAFWLVVGIVLTGILAALLPDDFFATVLGWDRGIIPMLAMAAVGVPLYLCASASTPVAAALVMKGLSPGAALVFLLTGPGTNASSLAVIGQLLGRRALTVFLASIFLTALAAGLLLDALAAELVRSAVRQRFAEPSSGLLGTVQGAAAVAFVALLVRSYWRTGFRDGRADVRDQLARLTRGVRAVHLRDLARPRVLVPALVLAALWLASRSYLVVEPGQRGIVQRFGRVVAGDLAPGLHLHLPPPLGSGRTVDVDLVRQVPVGFQGRADGDRRAVAGAGYLVTADENLVDVRAVVHYRVSDPVRFALGLDDADALIASLARRELVATASSTPIDALYGAARAESEARVRDALRERVAELDLGCEVTDLRLLDVHAPADVHEAFRDVASAAEDRQRERNDARGYAAERISTGEGEAATIVETARGAAVRARALASGEAAAFAGIAAAHAASPTTTELRLHLESLERALPAARKYVDGAGASRGDLDLWLGGSGDARATGGAAGGTDEMADDQLDAEPPPLGAALGARTGSGR